MKSKYFLLLLLLSPGFWWGVLQPSKLVSEWVHTPAYFGSKLASYTSEQRVLGIQDMRWAHVDTSGIVSAVSKIFYNRFLVVPDEVLDFLSFFSPKFYFQSGDGSDLSPPSTEPIASILFPFFIIGFTQAVRSKNWKILLGIVTFGFISYAVGKKNHCLFVAGLGWLCLFVRRGPLKDRNQKEQKFYVAFCCNLLTIYFS